MRSPATCWAPWTAPTGWVQLTWQIIAPVARVVHRKQHIVRQLALDADVPGDNVRRNAVRGRESVNTLANPKAWAERSKSRLGKNIGVPGAETGRGAPRRIAVKRSDEQVAVIHGHLAGAIFVRAAIHIILRETTLQDGLAVEGVRESDAGTQVIPSDVGAIVSCTTRAIAELRVGAQ